MADVCFIALRRNAIWFFGFASLMLNVKYVTPNTISKKLFLLKVNL